MVWEAVQVVYGATRGTWGYIGLQRVRGAPRGTWGSSVGYMGILERFTVSMPAPSHSDGATGMIQ